MPKRTNITIEGESLICDFHRTRSNLPQPLSGPAAATSAITEWVRKNKPKAQKHALKFAGKEAGKP